MISNHSSLKKNISKRSQHTPHPYMDYDNVKPYCLRGMVDFSSSSEFSKFCLLSMFKGWLTLYVYSVQSFKNKLRGIKLSWLIFGSPSKRLLSISLYKCLIFKFRHIRQIHGWPSWEPELPGTIITIHSG